jgi:hypothetical protein
MKKFYKAILALTLLFYIGFTSANDSVGMVVASRGEIVTKDARTLRQGDFVYTGDIVLTSSKGFIVIQFLDGSKITVRPNTTFEIVDFLYNGDDADIAKMNLLQGGLRIVSGSIAKNNPDSYTLNTPVALMGVRGTGFSVMLCNDSVCTE